MRKVSKSKNVWLLEVLGGDLIGIFSTKVNALESLDLWSKDSEKVVYEVEGLDKIKPFNNEGEMIHVHDKIGEGHKLLWLHKGLVDNGAGCSRIFGLDSQE